MDNLELIKQQQKQDVKAYMDTTQYDSLYKNKFYEQGSRNVKAKEFTPGDEKQDTAALGKKIFKTKNEAQRQYNAKIDKSLELTQKATAYTAETHYIVNQVEKNIYSEAASTRSEKFEPETMVYRLRNYCFTKEMFSSANIRANLAEYVALVKGYQELRSYDDRDYIDQLGYTASLMELFEKRIEIYLEQNRVSLSGRIIDDWAEPRSLDPKDLELWNTLLRSKKTSDEAEAEPTDEELKERIEATNARLVEEKESLDLLLNANLVNYQARYGTYEGRKAAMENEDFHAQSLIVLRGRLLLDSLTLKLRETSRKTDITPVEKERIIEGLKQEIEETKQDLDNIAERDFKRTLKEVTRRETGRISDYRMTRAEATDTDSDRACVAAKSVFTDLAARLDEVMNTARPFPNNEMMWTTGLLRDDVNAYANASHYREGHKEETELLKKALRDLSVMEAFRQEDLDSRPEVKQIVVELRAEFNKLTTGSSIIPPVEEIPRDLVRIAENHVHDTTNSHKGGTRNAILMSDRLSEWKDVRDTPLFTHEPTVNDLRQGKVSNCYMVAGTTGLIGVDPAIIKNAVRDNGNGTATVRLFKKGSKQKAIPVYVVVTKEIPKLKTGGDILSSGALWMQLIEKAAADLGRSDTDRGYQSLWYGEGGDWVFRLTGKMPQNVITNGDVASPVPSQKDPRRMTDYLSEEGKDILFDEIMNAKKNNVVFNCGTGENASDAMNAGHAYTVLGATAISGVRYVILRNPYANMSLRYDDQDRSYMKHGRTMSYFSSGIGETCGQFAMNFDEFLKEMHTITKTDLNGRFEEPHDDPAQWLQNYMADVTREIETENQEAARNAARILDDNDLID